MEQELAREKLAIERDLGRLVVFGRRVDPTGRTGPRLPIPNERVEVIAISITDSSGIFNRHSQSVIHVGLGGDGLQGNAASPVAGRVRGGDVRLDEALEKLDMVPVAGAGGAGSACGWGGVWGVLAAPAGGVGGGLAR